MNKNHPPNLRVLRGLVPAASGSKKRLIDYETGKILMVTDFSANAAIAEMRAAMLSVELGCYPLEIIAVMNADPANASRLQRIAAVDDIDGDGMGNAEEGLRKVACRLSKWQGLSYLCSIRFGNPVAGILERVAELQPRLVVTGAYGGSISANLARGYSTMDLVRAVDRPVLVVRNEPEGCYGKVIIAVDFSPASLQAASAAMELAGDANLYFVHVIEQVNAAYDGHEQVPNEVRLIRRIGTDRAAGLRLTRLVSDLGADQSRTHCTVRHGFAPSVIDEYAKEVGADLIVCGKQSDHSAGARIGSTAMGLLVQSFSDLLVISPASSKKIHGSDKFAA